MDGTESLSPSVWAAALAQRDFSANETTLSGDLSGDDVTGDFSLGRSDNSYHVVTAISTSAADAVTRSAVLDGFTISGGHAPSEERLPFGEIGGGGGIRLWTGDAGSVSSPTLRNLVIADNHALRGGGVVMRQTRFSAALASQTTLSPLFTNVTIRGNAAEEWGGGIALFASEGGTAAPVFVNLTAQANSAGSGGALYVNKWQRGSSVVDVRITNAVIAGNRGTGGALYAQGLVGVDFVHATIAANYSPDRGGAFLIDRASGETPEVRVDNSIAWANQADISSGSLSGGFSDETSRYADPAFRYSVVQEAVSGAGNATSDPLFLTSPSASAPTAQGDFRIREGSPAIDRGLAGLLPSDGADLDGDGDFSEALPRDVRGDARLQESAPDAGAYEGGFVFVPTLIYVRQGAAGDGSSWASALGSLADALRSANVATTIVVARGTYTPSATGDVAASFELVGGVEVYGGFAGNEALTLASLASALPMRDLASNQTILSGDLSGDDVPGSLTVGRSDNSRSVVRYVSKPSSADPVVLDGFTIRGGHAAQAEPFNTLFFAGGAQSCAAGLGQGGGVCVAVESGAVDVSFRHVRLEQNYAEYYGGGMFVASGDAATTTIRITDATLAGNATDQAQFGEARGGGLFLASEDGTLTADLRRVTFDSNASSSGGALYFGTDETGFASEDATQLSTLVVAESTSPEQPSRFVRGRVPDGQWFGQLGWRDAHARRPIREHSVRGQPDALRLGRWRRWRRADGAAQRRRIRASAGREQPRHRQSGRPWCGFSGRNSSGSEKQSRTHSRPDDRLGQSEFLRSGSASHGGRGKPSQRAQQRLLGQR